MTDNEIIKGLECCIDYVTKDSFHYCDNECPLHNDYDCDKTLLKITLDLINRQNAKINTLEKQVRVYGTQIGRERQYVKVEAIRVFAEMIVSDYPEMKHYLDNLAEEMGCKGDA